MTTHGAAHALHLAAVAWLSEHGVPDQPNSVTNPFYSDAEEAFYAAALTLGIDLHPARPEPRLRTAAEIERARITPAVRQRLIERAEGRCTACGAIDKLEIDHCLPVSRGGTSDDDNLTVLCSWCNRSKGTKTLEEWKAVMRGT